jgi:predicted PurR-regulated permease PerM
MELKHVTDRKFLAWLTLSLIVASLWIFKSYLDYLIVAAVLALATSHLYNALTGAFSARNKKGLVYKNQEVIAALILTCLFLFLIFGPLLYFISVTYEQASALDLGQIRLTLTEMTENANVYLEKIPFLQGQIVRLKQEGLSFINGPAVESAFKAAMGVITGAGSLLVQIIWIMIFYFLFNAYGHKILGFVAMLIPMSYEHEEYLYRESTGTVAVVFYGTLFNMVSQGIAFGLLMAFIGDYDAMYLGALTGFCSVIPIVGAALIYIPVVALELFAGNIVNGLIILAFSWVVMGFFIDNILRLVFIGHLKRMFGFEYRMNEILILLAILAGIATFGFWGMVIAPSVLALTFAAANLYSTGIDEQPVINTGIG